MQKKAVIDGSYSIYTTNQLLEAYQLGPSRVRQAINGLTENELKKRVIPQKWTIGEILVHLADSDIIGSCRIRQAYTEHPGDFPYYLEADWAEKLRYRNASLEDIDDCINLFEYLRKTTYKILVRFEESDWEKEGFHPQRGKMNLRQLLELYADHAERHIEQILARRILLGKPIKMEIHLKVRLY